MVFGVEEQFYLFYPLVLKKMKNGENLAVFLGGGIGIGLLSGWAAYGLEPNNWVLMGTQSFGPFGLLAMGAALFLCHKKFGSWVQKNRKIGLGLCVFGIGLVLWTFLYTHNSHPLDRIYSPFLIGLGAWSFLLGGLNLEYFESSFLKILAIPGKVSYGMYLLHSVVLYFLWPHLNGQDVFLAFSVFSIAVIAVSYLSFHFFETPMRQWVSRNFQ